MKEVIQKQINYEDADAARFVENIKGWVDINNRFWGNSPDSEHMARYSSCTHLKCECGKPMTKGWTKCEECRNKQEIKRYNELPFKEYNEDWVYSEFANEYFRDSDKIEQFCIDNDVDAKDLRLVLCKPIYFRQIGAEYWEDVLPDDSEGELPVELQKAVDALNEIINKLPPASYLPDKVRTEYKMDLLTVHKS